MRIKAMAAGTIVVAVALLLVLLAAGPVQGGTPTPQVELKAGIGPQPRVSSAILYQGKLTDSSGVPLPDSSYQLTFTLYLDRTPEPVTATYEVTVTTHNGLFTTPVDFSNQYGAVYFTGHRADISLQVEGVPEFDAQEIYPVPYALSLRPGAYIEDTEGPGPALEIRGGIGGPALLVTAYQSDGITGQGAQYGAGVHGIGGVFVYSPDESRVAGVLGEGGGDATGVEAYSESGVALDATGTGTIRSAASSYLWISGNDLEKEDSTDTARLFRQSNGGVRIWRGNPSFYKGFYLPVTIPGVLYGQSITVDEMTVYYRCSNGTNNYIGRTAVFMRTASGGLVTLVDSSTARTSNTATDYTLTLSGADGSGILSIYFELMFANDSEPVDIGGVRLKLSHN